MQRDYRNKVEIKRLTPFQVEVQESDLFIYAQKDLSLVAIESIKKVRLIIKNYISLHPNFLKTLKPHKDIECQGVIKEMVKASNKANVGPMASVAGVVSEYVGKRLLNYSSEVIVENGGDIFLKVDKPISIGIYAGKSPLSMKFALFITDIDTPFSVCTSSGSFGHSLSFGNADAVCVVSRSSALADATATSVANLIKKEEDIDKGMEFGKSIKGVKGLSVIMNNKAAFWGDFKIKEL